MEIERRKTLFEYTKQLRRKGWLSKEFAELLEITPRGLSRIAGDPKVVHWLALDGLPDRSKTPNK